MKNQTESYIQVRSAEVLDLHKLQLEGQLRISRGGFMDEPISAESIGDAFSYGVLFKIYHEDCEG